MRAAFTACAGAADPPGLLHWRSRLTKPAKARHGETMVSMSPRPVSFLSVVSCGYASTAWPIEVGWGFGTGPIRTMLLVPSEDWSLLAWDKHCEGTHKVPLEILVREGKKPLDAALVLNAALGQSTVYAGNPRSDSLWLYKLYKAAKVDPNFQLEPSAIEIDPLPPRVAARVEALRSAFTARAAS